MHVFILTLGTRGDLELFLTLGTALRERGHQIVVGTSPFHESRVRQCGFSYEGIGWPDRAALVSVLEALVPVRDRVQRTRLYHERWLAPQLRAFRERATALVAHTDAFVSNLKLSLRREGRPLRCAAVTYDPPLGLDETGPPPADGDLNLVALSRALVDPEARWDTRHRFTGFWRGALSESRLHDHVRAFLEAGDAPVVATLGSMATFDVARFLRVFERALEISGRRGLVVAGWSTLPRGTQGTERVFVVQDAPYAALLPEAACVLHHGGTGTVAEVLAAGRPSILLPQIACQERFAERLVDAGLATGVFDVDALEAEALAEAIVRAVGDAEVAERVRTWRERVVGEAGAAAAAAAIEEHVGAVA